MYIKLWGTNILFYNSIGRDYDRPELNLDDCSGNTQTVIQKVTKSERKVRLVTINYRGLTTNIDDLHHFFQVNRNIVKLVDDIGHTVNVYGRHDIRHNDSAIRMFSGQNPFVRRSQKHIFETPDSHFRIMKIKSLPEEIEIPIRNNA
ncbi:hypothetical protein BCR42DRAFT_397824 [Absidia repens]|uniref:Uncharacterized protein n=1 Tax=Absidia repens TaxID=90262 RepID=A0A1X2I126_9FUNG|nr:hypothetical protein BCR42DRAFT_397824 [Absidia repens]